jgi:hypothetical protein
VGWGAGVAHPTASARIPKLQANLSAVLILDIALSPFFLELIYIDALNKTLFISA